MPTSGGSASTSVSTLAVGSHTITARFDGGGTTETSDPLIHVVEAAAAAPTTTTLASAPNPSTVGQAVTLTATVVAPGAGTPTGDVVFRDGTTALGTVPLGADGTAVLVTSLLSLGGHQLTAGFLGNAAFAASASAAITHTVTLVGCEPFSHTIANGDPATTDGAIRLEVDALGAFGEGLGLASSVNPAGHVSERRSAAGSLLVGAVSELGRPLPHRHLRRRRRHRARVLPDRADDP